MPNFLCKQCGKTSYSRHPLAQFCGKECFYKNQTGAFEATSRDTKKQGSCSSKTRYKKIRVKKKLDKKGFFITKKQEYLDKVIDYDGSPTGEAYIGINKQPLMPNKTGYGFQGVLLQDGSRQFIQCSSCGVWVRKITNSHLNQCSNGKIKTTARYKQVFGLYKSLGLVSDETSLRLTEASLKNKKSILDKFAEKYAGKKTVNRSTRISIKRRQWQNRHGNCPEQIKHNLREFVLCNRELPGRKNRGMPLYKTLRRRFGTFGAGLQYYGLPKFQRTGTTYKYTFPDYTVYQFNINQMHDREALFNLMLEKCPLLKKTTT